MNYKAWILTISILTILIVGSFTVKGNLIAARNGTMSEQAATVETIHIEQVPHQAYIDVNGVIKAPQTLNLVNEVPGKITKLLLESGGMVGAGEVLLEIDHAEENAALQAAQAHVKQQSNTVTRYKNLYQLDKISIQQLEEVTTQLTQYQADVDLLRAKISKKVITAPFDARVGIHDLQVSQYLPINSSISQLVGLQDYMWIDFSLPQTYQQLALNTQVTLTLLDKAQTKLLAKVISVAPEVSKNSRQLKYRAKVSTKQISLTANQLIKVTAPIGDSKQVFAIPYLAVIKDQLGNYVYLLAKDDEGILRAQRHQVSLGERMGDLVMITDGLTTGSMIANQGAFKLRNGLKTFVKNSLNKNTIAMKGETEKELSL